MCLCCRVDDIIAVAESGQVIDVGTDELELVRTIRLEIVKALGLGGISHLIHANDVPSFLEAGFRYVGSNEPKASRYIDYETHVRKTSIGR